MTKINRIVMDGFKSFGKRVELVFGNSFNCILGPNGSGKSNVLDALCFVLGKSSSKSMRAEKSANLIYNGGKSKKPAKEGSVSIYFDNSNKTFPTDDPFVKVTRVVRANGQGVYKINDKVRTREQIKELLSNARVDPDGYNIILQGDIVNLVNMSPLERRRIIEEIAGIGVYEEKKNKAIKELDKVEQRLNDADIVLKERESYLKDLKKDRDQALKFKNLNDQIKQNKASYLKRKLEKKEAEKEVLDKKIDGFKKKVDKFSKKSNELREKIKTNREEINKISKEVEEKGATEQVQLNKQIENLRVSIATNTNRLNTCKAEIDKISQRKEQLEKNLSEVGGRIDELKKEKKRLETSRDTSKKMKDEFEAKIEKFKKKNKLMDTGDVEKRVDEIDAEVEEEQKKIQQLREEQQELLREKDKYEFQLQTIDQQMEKVKQIEKEHKDEIESIKKKREQLKKSLLELNELLTKDTELAANLGDKRSRLLKVREELAKIAAKKAANKEQVSVDIAVKKILENKNKIGGIFGTIADLGTVKSKYSIALEVAAGAKIKSIVVEDDEVAARCIRFLKEKKLGRATFLPLNKIRGFNKDPNVAKLKSARGVHGLAIDLVEFDSRFKNAFSFVFGNTLVVDNIDVARRIGIGAAKMTTLDGDVAETSGAMIGGYRHKNSGAFRTSEINVDSSKLESELNKLDKEVPKHEEKRMELEKKIANLREFNANLEGDIIKMEKGLHLDSSDMKASKEYKAELKKKSSGSDKKLRDIQDDIMEINRGMAKLKTEKQQLRDQINELRNPLKLAELNTYEQKKTELTEEIMQFNADLKNITVQIEEILGRDSDDMNKVLKDMNKEESDFKNELKDLQKKIKSENSELKKKETEQNKFKSQFTALFQKRNKLSDQITNFENELFKTDEVSRKEEHKMNLLSVEDAKLKAELAGLNTEFMQYEGVELNMQKSEEQLDKEIKEFEKMRENIGSVNMRALEIYDTVEKEYNSLLEKKEKLHSEKESVIQLMEEIEGKKTDLFMKTFDVVNQNFKNIFSALSTKGEATLELENPEQPFEEGLRIKVRITSNKFLDIRSLSGGEKTMTALAFLFAVQDHEPAPFYVLDEVDAALDKHNSEKLAKLIRQYCDNAQYVIISHNDAVISEADTLYGISMNEHGLSKVVSLKI